MTAKRIGWLTCAILGTATSGWALTTVDVGGNNSVAYPATWAGLYSAVTNASARSASDDVLVRVSDFDGVGGAADYKRSWQDMTNGLALAVTNQSATYRITIRGGYSQDFAVQSGRTTIDGNIRTSMNPGGQITTTAGAANDESRRVFTLTGAGGLVALRDLVVTGGGVVSNMYLSVYGVGILADCRVRLTGLDISRNAYDDNEKKNGGGLHLTSAAGGSVVEYCAIEHNFVSCDGAGIRTYTTSAVPVLVANTVIADNRSSSSFQGGTGIGVGGGTGPLLWGCVLRDNSAGRATVRREYSGSAIRLINCTVADNSTTNPFAYAEAGSGLQIRNTILADNTGDVQYTPLYIGRSVFDDDTIVGGYTDEGGVVTNSAMAFKDQPNRDYRLTAACVKAIDQGGYLRTTNVTFSTGSATVKYVDVDNNLAYGALTDIIVKLESGTAPAEADYEAHYIYTKDLAGRPRVRIGGIDAGAYEYQPPAGTVVTFR